MGNMTPRAISTTLGVSPTPSQMISSGMMPTNGTVRSICTGASTTSSPILDSPEMSASAMPSSRPISSPVPTRCSDAAIADPSCPSEISVMAWSQTALGEPTIVCGSFPAELRSCQMASTTTTPTSLRSTLGTRRRRRCCGRIRSVASTPVWPASASAGFCAVMGTALSSPATSSKSDYIDLFTSKSHDRLSTSGRIGLDQPEWLSSGTSRTIRSAGRSLAGSPRVSGQGEGRAAAHSRERFQRT